MAVTVRAPSGRSIWKAVRDELLLNLYPLPFSTLAPTVFRIYIHPDDFEAIEAVTPRIVAQVQGALTAEVDKTNLRLNGSGRRFLARLLDREELAPIEVPSSGWEVYIQPDRNGELERGTIGIVSALALPAPVEYGGTPTTRIVKSVVGRGRRTATTSEVPREQAQAAPETGGTSAAVPDSTERARLTYEDERGPHVFVMKKDTLSVGRGGSSAWVDVQVIASSKVSREHFRLRRDGNGDFFIQDVSLWGTFVDGEPLPPAVKNEEGVAHPGAERPLAPSARIGLADAIVMRFEAIGLAQAGVAPRRNGAETS
jgi:pSer/pThr/pTyr-binding forkhead associated (FHA) protein